MTPNTQKRIILIDDDHGPMDYYVDATREKQIEVQHIDDVDDALALMRDPKFIPPNLFVIDIMMPHGLSFTADETNHGVETGYLVIKECRKLFPETPVICLTNVNKNVSQERQPDVIKHLAKYETSPFQFADIIACMLNT